MNNKKRLWYDSIISSYVLLLLLFTPYSAIYAAIIDRVVAYVDNTAITLSELELKYEMTCKITPGISKEEVLNTMINRLLLLKEARKMRLEAFSEDELLKEYIDLKIKTFIQINENEIEDFFQKNIRNFQNREFEDVSEEIEKYLIEAELNRRLKSHINELREKACIKTQL
jgi:ribosomal protein S13